MCKNSLIRWSGAIPLKSQWPLNDAEKSIIPESDTRDYQSWKKPGQAPPARRATAPLQVTADTQHLVREAHRIDSVEARDLALTEIGKRIGSADDETALSGLSALAAVQAVDFNKAAWREPVRARLTATNGTLRAAALRALPVVDPEPTDLDRILSMVEDPAELVRQTLPSVIVALSNRDLTGKSGAAILRLLSNENEGARRQVLQVLWGARVSPELEQRLIELTRAESGGRDALYFGLSTVANKSEAGVDRLIALLGDPDIYNVAGRAVWGLGQGIPEHLKSKVAQAVLRLLETRSDPFLREECLARLEAYGTPAELSGLNAIAARPAISRAYLEKVQKTMAAIEQRTRR